MTEAPRLVVYTCAFLLWVAMMAGALHILARVVGKRGSLGCQGGCNESSAKPAGGKGKAGGKT